MRFSCGGEVLGCRLVGMETIRIRDIAFGGDGVGVRERDGKVVLVPFVAKGEVVEVEMIQENKRMGRASLVRVVESATERVEPVCPHFSRCGGCSYQHVDYATQVEWKRNQVEQLLRRVGKLGDVVVSECVPAPSPLRYRNRIRVHARGGVIGFVSHDAATLVDVAECLIACDSVNDQLKELRAVRGVRDGEYSLKARAGTQHFEQTNDCVAELLLDQVAGMLPERMERLVDAYCGAGFFARGLASRCEEVVGIEEHPSAVKRARNKAGENERYFEGRVEEILGDVLAQGSSDATVVLLDPPAAGVGVRVTDLLSAARPARIIYISCDPATLARDVAALNAGYVVEKVVPVDMFPQTAEVEVVLSMKRRG